MPVTPHGIQTPHVIATLTDQNTPTFLRKYMEDDTSVKRHVSLGDAHAGFSLAALVAVAK